MAVLARFKGLRRLELRNTDITDKGLAKLAPLTELEYLIVSHTKVDGTALANLTTLKQLKRLDISSVDLVPASLVALKQFDKLRDLSLSQCHLRNPDLRPVGLCPSISSLDISDDPLISDKGMIELKPLKKLTFLNISGTVITSKGLQSLKGLPLERIKIRPKDFPAAVKNDISKALPGVKFLDDNFLDESLKVYKEVFQ
jgi:internalin A